MVGSGDSGKTYLIHECLRVGKFQPNFNKKYFLYQHPQPLYDVMQEEGDILEFFQGVNFGTINSLKNNGTNYLLIFDYSFAEICNSKEFVDISIACRHHGFSTIFIKHNLFHQSKLGSDFELQISHIVLFLHKSPTDVHQVATIGVQSGTGFAFVDSYRDATSVHIGHFLIEFSTRTDDRLRYCTKSGKNPSNFYVPDELNHLKRLDDEYTKSVYSLSISTLFPRMQNLVSKNLSKRNYPISQRVYRQHAARKLVRSKKSHVLKYRDNIYELFPKRTTRNHRRSLFLAQNLLLLKQTNSTFAINHLS